MSNRPLTTRSDQVTWLDLVPDDALTTLHHGCRVAAKHPMMSAEDKSALARAADLCWGEHARRCEVSRVSNVSGQQDEVAPRDLDVELLLREFIGREPTENEWEIVPFLRTLRRVERRLEMGGHHARIVAEALAAGAITVVNE